MRTHGTLTLVEMHNEAKKLDGFYWRLDADPHVHARAKRVFGKLGKAQGGDLLLSVNAETAADLEWFMARYPLQLSEQDARTLRSSASQHRDMIQRLEDIIGPDYVPYQFRMARPPRSYQAKEAEIYLTKGGLLVGDDVGLGKTVTGICSLTDQRTLPALIVVPAHLPRQWEARLREFLPELNVHRLRKGTPYELPKFMGQGPDVLISTYHKLVGWQKVLASYCRSVIFDECQELRHAGTGKYNAAEHVARHAKFRLGLSATPTYNYGGEIFNVLDLLVPGCLGTHGEFVNEWCGGGGQREVLRSPSAFGTWAREQFLMVRNTRKDVGRELPHVTVIPQVVGSDRKALDEIKDQATALAKLILDQSQSEVVSKWQASEQLSTMLRQATGISKAPYVARFVQLLVESGEKVLLGGWHREVYSIWQKVLDGEGIRWTMYTGSESAAEKAEAIRKFGEKDCRVMMMSLRSGIGVDGLEKVCSCVVFGELDWSPYVHKQFLGRLDRDGQKVPVVAYYMMCEDGADPEIAEVLGLKLEQGEGIRNPVAAEQFFSHTDEDRSRAQQLARAYLEKVRTRAVADLAEATT